MRDFLLASATAASFGGLRASSASSQGGDERPRPRLACWITAVAPATNTLRNLSSPARVILPSRVFPAGALALGVSPIPAAKGPPDGDARGSGALITNPGALVRPH